MIPFSGELGISLGWGVVCGFSVHALLFLFYSAYKFIKFSFFDRPYLDD